MKQSKTRKYKKIILLIIIVFGSVNCMASVQRIISLAPVFTKIILQLGGEDNLVGCTSFCKTNNKKQVVGSAISLNIEKILLLKPDLVLASSLTSDKDIETLKKLRINVVEFQYAKSFQDICNQTLLIAKAINKETLANNVIEEAKAQLQKAINNIPKEKLNTKSVFIQIGANPIFTVVPNTFMNDFITYSGCKNIASNMISGSITKEAVITSNPDYIFVVLMGLVSKEESQKWKLYSTMKAVKNQNIFELDPDKACSPTINDFVDVVSKMINLIYNV